MRTRMSGRVAGESGRPLPLCRFEKICARLASALNAWQRQGFEEPLDVAQVIEDRRRDPNISFGYSSVHLSFGQTLADVVSITNNKTNDRRSRFGWCQGLKSEPRHLFAQFFEE